MAGNIVNLGGGKYRLRYKDFSENVTAKSDHGAERLLAKFITKVDSGDFKQGGTVTFRKFAEKWLTDYAEIELAPKTLFRYKQVLESRIFPAIGDKRLDKVKPLDLVEFYNKMRKEHKFFRYSADGPGAEETSAGLSEKTIKTHHSLISAIYDKAIRWDVYKGDNPAKRVDAPKPEKKKARCYDEAETQKLLETLDRLTGSEVKYKAAAYLAIMTGARLGEIMGLEWQDVDFTKKTVEIRQTSQYLPGQGTFTKQPKTELSKRKISVNDTLLTTLAQYREDQQEKGFLCRGTARLFVTWDGKPMHTYTMTDWFPIFLKKNGLPALNFHGLRHTSATFLISRGMDIQTVAGRLGHSTSATTQNIYSHFLESKDRQAADLMEAAFTKKGEAPAPAEEKKAGKVIALRPSNG
jgi:integrase